MLLVLALMFFITPSATPSRSLKGHSFRYIIQATGPQKESQCLLYRTRFHEAIELLKTLNIIPPRNVFYIGFRRPCCESVKAGCYVVFDQGFINVKVIDEKSDTYVINYTVTLENATLICYPWSLENAKELFVNQKWATLSNNGINYGITSTKEIKLSKILYVSKVNGVVVDERGRDLGEWVFWLDKHRDLILALLYPIRFESFNDTLDGMATLLYYNLSLKGASDYMIGREVVPKYRTGRAVTVYSWSSRITISCANEQTFRRFAEICRNTISNSNATWGMKLTTIPENYTIVWENIYLKKADTHDRLHKINFTFKEVNCTRVEHGYYLLHRGLKWMIAPVNRFEFTYDTETGVLLEARQIGDDSLPEQGAIPAPLSNYFILEGNVYPIWYSMTCDFKLRLIKSSLYSKSEYSSREESDWRTIAATFLTALGLTLFYVSGKRFPFTLSGVSLEIKHP
ncbi:MAG: hypothetical protein DRJ37_02000 [Thermoprotei archaeon]|nr:MAG: hypothetical protein DRJ37_02000 [Thermoprotei archaeon]